MPPLVCVQGQISRGFYDVNGESVDPGDKVTLDSSLDQALLCNAIWNVYVCNPPLPQAPQLTHEATRDLVTHLLEQSAEGILFRCDEALTGAVLVQFRIGKQKHILVEIMADVLRKVGTACWD